MAEDAKVMGIIIGECSSLEWVDDTADVQFRDFKPNVEGGFGYLPTAEYISIDLVDGIYTVWDESGEPTATGKVFNSVN